MCFVCQGLKCFPEICVTASTCAIMCMKQIKKLYLSVYLESSILLLNCSALCFICSIWEASSCPASWVILVIAYRLSKHMSLTTNLSHSNCFQCFHFLIQFCSRFLLIDLQFAYLVPPWAVAHMPSHLLRGGLQRGSLGNRILKGPWSTSKNLGLVGNQRALCAEGTMYFYSVVCCARCVY